MQPARVVLADDHKMVSEGLQSLLEDEFNLVATVEDGRALVSAAEKLRPDDAILHISPRTAEFHKYRMMEELNIRTSAELIQYAIKHDITSVRPSGARKNTRER
jgi:DNA-binding NarL/FixJ family response regulator